MLKLVAALFLILPATQDQVLPVPDEIVLPLGRDDRMASIERSMQLERFSPATRRVISGMVADFTYIAERRNTERNALMSAAEETAHNEPFDVDATLAALNAVDAFDRANTDDKPALNARILRAVPPFEQAAVARYLIGNGFRGDGAEPPSDAQD